MSQLKLKLKFVRHYVKSYNKNSFPEDLHKPGLFDSSAIFTSLIDSFKSLLSSFQVFRKSKKILFKTSHTISFLRISTIIFSLYWMVINHTIVSEKRSY